MSADKTPPTKEEMAVDYLAKLWGFASNDFTARCAARSDEYRLAFQGAEIVLKQYGYDTTALRKKHLERRENNQ